MFHPRTAYDKGANELVVTFKNSQELVLDADAATRKTKGNHGQCCEKNRATSKT